MAEQEYREFLIKLGACPECMSIPEHHIDEPFATCGCWTSENYAKSPLMQAQLMRAALKEMADTIEMLRTDTGADDEAAHTLHLYAQYKTKPMTDWIKHNSTEPPALAPAAYVKARVYTLDKSAFSLQARTVKSIPWRRCDQYLQLTDPEGVPYCGAEGLEDWAEYVATDSCGEVWQYSLRPTPYPRSWDSNKATRGYAPDTHQHPGDWRNSLMRVWRF